MRPQITTQAIILRRTDYGEADRIVMLLTEQQGKMSAIAKGVRKPKSKLAGGLELFATCEVTILTGKGDVGTITSARLGRFFGNILQEYDRMQLAYACIKECNRVAETLAEPEVFYLLRDAFIYLDELSIDYQWIELWFRLGILHILGTGFNATIDVTGTPLLADQRYEFSMQDAAFAPVERGRFTGEHIKLLRLAAAKNPAVLRQILGAETIREECLQLLRRTTM